jgi:hypothetical protein
MARTPNAKTGTVEIESRCLLDRGLSTDVENVSNSTVWETGRVDGTTIGPTNGENSYRHAGR